ncbi:hypothetical protein FQA47_005718 [Oryzias melastigma]|uniref:Uncharacterized protein n=1 Tax=Oryzias melastigma TaxID=30732 RepID=A0A834L3J1_ORYME|nr:hypothetical protein FQA47_005718 [Oryzias melastigma]
MFMQPEEFLTFPCKKSLKPTPIIHLNSSVLQQLFKHGYNLPRKKKLEAFHDLGDICNKETSAKEGFKSLHNFKNVFSNLAKLISSKCKKKLQNSLIFSLEMRSITELRGLMNYRMDLSLKKL